MIDFIAKIHDKFTLEFKALYKARHKIKINNFTLNTWIFVPNSLDINKRTYNHSDFYKDLRTNIRLITPVFLLREIAGGNATPLNNLQRAMNELTINPTRSNASEYEYQIKMFAAIFKSALREQLNFVFDTSHSNQDRGVLIEQLIADVENTMTKYRTLSHIIKAPTITKEQFSYFTYGDEFICNLSLKEIYGLVYKLEKKKEEELLLKLRNRTVCFLEQEEAYKIKQNYPTFAPYDKQKNSDIIFRFGALKKYIESDLFLNANKKKDGVLMENFHQSIAAGLAMIFATAVAFSVQKTFGNLTVPLFVALVVSYMLKDRIKEYMRYYFASKQSGKYFDNKTTISIKENEIGWTKESFDFISESDIPPEVLRVRNRLPLLEAGNRFSKEKIILFKKTVYLNRKELDDNTTFNVAGVAEILRLNLSSFMRKMDNPEFPLFMLDKNKEIGKIAGTKNYFMNIVVQSKFESTETLQRYRITFNRDEIVNIKKM
ncbi:MAG: hypothetical protein QM751_07915 [Paludibacteraceae bacterium]